MDEDVRAAWVAALRSGEYKQGHGALCQDDPREGGKDGKLYCCLGVLAELAAKAGIVSPAKKEEEEEGVSVRWLYSSKSGDYSSFLSREMRKWAGIEDRDPTVTIHSRSVPLSKLNDELGYTFDDIADVIEADGAGDAK